VIAAIGTATPAARGSIANDLRALHRRIRRCGGRQALDGCRTAFEIGPCAKFILKDVFSVVWILLHDDEFAVIDVAKIFKVFDGPVVPVVSPSVSCLQFNASGTNEPFHQENPRH
jgi:hypothetical protein